MKYFLLYLLLVRHDLAFVRQLSSCYRFRQRMFGTPILFLPTKEEKHTLASIVLYSHYHIGKPFNQSTRGLRLVVGQTSRLPISGLRRRGLRYPS